MNKYMIPCKDCKNRSPGCHDRCEAYMAVKREHDEVKRKRDEALMIDRMNAASARKGTSIRRKFRRDK